MADKKMCRDTPFYIYRNAKHLRQHATEAEKKLWLHLKERTFGFKFRRQHRLAIYIADFYCHKAALVIEVDGMIHADADVIEYCRRRDETISQMNLRLLRFSNKEVLGILTRF